VSSLLLNYGAFLKRLSLALMVSLLGNHLNRILDEPIRDFLLDSEEGGAAAATSNR